MGLGVIVGHCAELGFVYVGMALADGLTDTPAVVVAGEMVREKVVHIKHYVCTYV